MIKVFRQSIALMLAVCLLAQQSGFAQAGGVCPLLPGYLQQLLPAERFQPVRLSYVGLAATEDKLELALDAGSGQVDRDSLHEESLRLMRYFQIGLRLPDSVFWVNLRPDSADAIIDPRLEDTDLGRVLLEADLQLKKDLARMTDPLTPEGRIYWQRLYTRAQELYGCDEIELPTCVRPWIVPGEIILGETPRGVQIHKAALKVMLEEDYLPDSRAAVFGDQRAKLLNEYSCRLLKELILPALTRQVNAAKRYAGLRQVYSALILAQWYKTQRTFLRRMIDTENLSGLRCSKPWDKAAYFKAYRESLSRGEYSKQEPAANRGNLVIRQYRSGGESFQKIVPSASVRSAAPGTQIVYALDSAGLSTAKPGIAVDNIVNIYVSNKTAGGAVGMARLMADSLLAADPELKVRMFVFSYTPLSFDFRSDNPRLEMFSMESLKDLAEKAGPLKGKSVNVDVLEGLRFHDELLGEGSVYYQVGEFGNMHKSGDYYASHDSRLKGFNDLSDPDDSRGMLILNRDLYTRKLSRDALDAGEIIALRREFLERYLSRSVKESLRQRLSGVEGWELEKSIWSLGYVQDSRNLLAEIDTLAAFCSDQRNLDQLPFTPDGKQIVLHLIAGEKVNQSDLRRQLLDKGVAVATYDEKVNGETIFPGGVLMPSGKRVPITVIMHESIANTDFKTFLAQLNGTLVREKNREFWIDFPAFITGGASWLEALSSGVPYLHDGYDMFPGFQEETQLSVLRKTIKLVEPRLSAEELDRKARAMFDAYMLGNAGHERIYADLAGATRRGREDARVLLDSANMADRVVAEVKVSRDGGELSEAKPGIAVDNSGRAALVPIKGTSELSLEVHEGEYALVPEQSEASKTVMLTRGLLTCVGLVVYAPDIKQAAVAHVLETVIQGDYAAEMVKKLYQRGARQIKIMHTQNARLERIMQAVKDEGITVEWLQPQALPEGRFAVNAGTGEVLDPGIIDSISVQNFGARQLRKETMVPLDVTPADVEMAQIGPGRQTGGVDFRSLAMHPVSADRAALEKIARGSAISDLKAEWQEIERAIPGDAVPYARIKTYLAVCCLRGDAAGRQRVAFWLHSMLAAEAECAVSSAPEATQLLAMLAAE